MRGLGFVRTYSRREILFVASGLMLGAQTATLNTQTKDEGRIYNRTSSTDPYGFRGKGFEKRLFDECDSSNWDTITDSALKAKYANGFCQVDTVAPLEIEALRRHFLAESIGFEIPWWIGDTVAFGWGRVVVILGRIIAGTDVGLRLRAKILKSEEVKRAALDISDDIGPGGYFFKYFEHSNDPGRVRLVTAYKIIHGTEYRFHEIASDSYALTPF